MRTSIGCVLMIAALALGAPPGSSADWNPRLAAQYLDAREKAWFAWPPAKISGGPCFSCHTNMTYLLARPALRRALHEGRPTEYETGLLNALRARAGYREPKELSPTFAREPLASQALGVEAVFSALFLAREDSERETLSATTRQAFDRMWSLQNASGAWSWFSLRLDPWEMPESPFYGATLALLAAGATPPGYRSRPEVKERLAALAEYLRREQQVQPLHNRLLLLWATAKPLDVLSESARREIVAEALGKQQSDGGWTIESLGPWAPHAAAPPPPGSDSYATAVAAFALEQAGVPRSEPKLARALEWLRSRQDRQSGAWEAESMNKRYEPGSMQSQFMRDAATAFAALALLE